MDWAAGPRALARGALRGDVIELASCFSRSQEKRTAFQEEFGVPKSAAVQHEAIAAVIGFPCAYEIANLASGICSSDSHREARNLENSAGTLRGARPPVMKLALETVEV